MRHAKLIWSGGVFAVFFGIFATGVIGATWNSVYIGGGGYVTGVFTLNESIFSRTDVGGAYRAIQDSAGQLVGWKQLMDWSLPSDAGNFGVISMLVADLGICAAVGRPADGPGKIMCSGDWGESWHTVTPVNWDEWVDGNAPLRAGGERLSLERGRALFGGQSGKLWVAPELNPGEDKVVLWNFVSFEHIVKDDGIGGTWQSADLNVSVILIRGQGVFWNVWGNEFDFNGWKLIGGSPVNVMRLTMSGNDLWVTHDDGVCVAAVESNGTFGDFSCSTPDSAKEIIAWNGIVVESGLCVVAPLRDDEGSKLYYSKDRGQSWNTYYLVRTTDVPWARNGMYVTNPAISSLASTASGHLILGDWYSHWVSVGTWTDPSNQPLQLQAVEIGHEEVVVHAVHSPVFSNASDVLTGCADVSGFSNFEGVSTFPSSKFDGQDTYHFDEAIDGTLLRVGADRYESTSHGYTGYHSRVAVSSNVGRNWTDLNWDATFPGLAPLRGVFASSPSTIAVLAMDGNLYTTSSNGSSWTNATFPTLQDAKSPWWSAQPLASSQRSGAVFLFVRSPTPTLYRSSTLLKTYSPVPITPALPTSYSFYSLFTPSAPYTTAPDEVFLAINGTGGGIWIVNASSSSPTSLRLPSITSAQTVTVGPPLTSTSFRTIYAFAVLQNDTAQRMWRTSDEGQTWTSMFNASQALGDGVASITASNQNPGRIYVGTSGRGVLYGE